MERHLAVIALLAIVLGGCSGSKIRPEEKPKSAFIEPFPGWKMNLEKKWGESFKLFVDHDTITVTINHDRKSNINSICLDGSKDTLKCYASKYKQAYFLSEPKDSTFNIYMVNFEKEFVIGLRTFWLQMFETDRNVESGYMEEIRLPELDTKQRFFLKPDKKELYKIYSSFLAGTVPDSLIKN